MKYVYILRSKQDKELYIGCTSDLKQRIPSHNNRKVRSTSAREPFELIFYEAFSNQSDAFAREKWLKTGWGRNHLQKMLANSLRSKSFGGNGHPHKLSQESLGG